MGAPGTVEWDDEPEPDVTWDDQPSTPAFVYYEAPKPKPPVPVVPQAPVAWYESLLRGAGEMASLDLGDEMAGVGASVAEQLDPAIQEVGRSADSPTAYEASRDQYRGENHQAKEDNPLWYLAGQATGLATTAALPVSRAVPAASMGLRAVRAATAAAPLGAIAGWGASEDETDVGQAFDALGGAEAATITAPVFGEAGHQIMTRVGPAMGRASEAIQERLGNTIGQRRQARLIEAAHGPEAAQRALSAADPLTPQGKEFRKLVHAAESPEAIEAHARQITDDVSGIAKHGDVIQANETIAAKARTATKYMQRDQVDPDAVVQAADNTAKNYRQQIQEMLTGVAQGTDDHRLLKRIEKEALEYDLKPIEGVGAYEVAGDRWSRVDQLKRGLQRKLKDVRFNSPEVEQLHNMEESLRTTLEDADLWGEGAAGYQVQVNRAWQKTLGLEQTRDLNPRREFHTDYRGVPSAAERSYRTLPEGDLPGILDTVQKAGTPEGEQALWKLAEMSTRRAGLGEALTNHIEPDVSLRARAAEQDRLAVSIGERLAQRQREAQASQALTRGERNLPVDSNEGPIGAFLEGLPVAGPPIRALRAPGQPLGQRARQIGQLENQLEVNPGNKVARNALNGMTSNRMVRQALSSLFSKPEQLIGYGANAGTNTAIRTHPGSDYLGDKSQEALTAKSQGHELESTIEQALRTNPSVLGPYVERLAQAQQAGTLGQELLKLNSDSTWRTKVKPQLQQAR